MGFVGTWLTFDKVRATRIVAPFMAYGVDVTQLVVAVVSTHDLLALMSDLDFPGSSVKLPKRENNTVLESA